MTEEGIKFQKTLNRIVTILKAKYKPQKIILFGSASQGILKEGSDIDLFIVKKTRKKHTERVWEVEDILFGINLPVDTVIYTPAEFQYAQKIKSMFVEDILERGKVLYG